MSSLPPLDVSLSSRRMSCILDGELALSRQGLMFATRLAQEANVWLFRALWQTLDNSYYLRDMSEQRPGAALSESEAFPSLRILQQWEMARLETDLYGLQLFFVGDARHESLLPKDIGKDLVSRFELLADELAGLHQESGTEAQLPFDLSYECWRDTAALAAALLRHRPIIFSLCPQLNGSEAGGAGEPALCRFLRRCGVQCHLVDADRSNNIIREHLLPTFARTGITELLWDIEQDKKHLAVVHVVAPNALVIPVDREFDRGFGDEAPASSEAFSVSPNLFYGAKAYWWKYE